MEEIKLIIADEWKIDFVKQLQAWVREGMNMGDMMKQTMKDQLMKSRSKEIKGIIDKVAKNPGKYVVPFDSQAMEADFYAENVKALRERI